MKKDRLSDPTQEGADLIMETQTVTASGGNVSVTFNESYSSAPTVLVSPNESGAFDCSVDKSTVNTSGCDLNSTADKEIAVLVIGLE